MYRGHSQLPSKIVSPRVEAQWCDPQFRASAPPPYATSQRFEDISPPVLRVIDSALYPRDVIFKKG